MLASSRQRQSTSPGAARFRGILVTLVLPAALWSAGVIINVPNPSGGDDTARLQQALDAAVAHGPGATVQLAAGTYKTRQLVAYNFHGTFKGAGEDKTTIEAENNLCVNITNSWDENWPLPSATHPWPVLITFVDGDIRVSDLTIKEPWPYATATTGFINPTFPGDWPNYGLYDVILFMGKNPTYAVVERVSFEGVQDNNLDWGYNTAMGVDYSAYYPASPTPGDYYFMEGNFTVQNCSFKNMFNAAAFDGRHKHNQVIIGGSPGSGNVCENCVLGLDLELAQNSMFDVSFNQISATWVALWENYTYSTNLGSYTPTTSYFLIHDNTLVTTANTPGFTPPFAGIWLVDNNPPLASPWIRASIYNNKIGAENSPSDGILLQDTQGTSIWHNTFTGNGTDAINLTGATQCTVMGNTLGGFTATPKDICIDPTSSHNLVVCTSPTDTVQDLGTNDTLIIP